MDDRKHFILCMMSCTCSFLTAYVHSMQAHCASKLGWGVLCIDSYFYNTSMLQPFAGERSRIY
jgi:hypothetical protein